MNKPTSRQLKCSHQRCVIRRKDGPVMVVEMKHCIDCHLEFDFKWREKH